MFIRDFASLAVRLQPNVPGCPRPTITQYIRQAAIQSCERTLAWRYEQAKFDLIAGTYVYNFNKPADTQVHVVFKAFANDSPLEVLTLDKALELYPAWADRYTNAGDIEQYGSDPRSITQISPHQYAVLPLPDATKPYTMRMFYALKPTRDADGMDQAVFDDLEDVIMHGALQQLMVLPNTAWGNLELASYHAKQYAFQISERRARANLGNARGMMRVQMQPFGA
jgi:hypothetical protein